MKRRDVFYKSSTDPDFEEGITKDVMFVSDDLALEVNGEEEWTFRTVTAMTGEGIPVIDMSTSPSFFAYLPFGLEDVDLKWLTEEASFMDVIRKYLKVPE